MKEDTTWQFGKNLKHNVLAILIESDTEALCEIFALKCQRKKGQIYNIRPANWKENSRGVLKPFSCKEEFIAALYHTHLSESNQTKVSKAWLDNVIAEYEKYCGENMGNRIMAYIRGIHQ